MTEEYEVSETEVQILAAAEQRARDEGVCYLRFTAQDDGDGVTVTEETDHVQELEGKVNG